MELDIKAQIFKNNKGEFVASESYGFEIFYFRNKGVGYEFEDGQEIIINTYEYQGEKKIVTKFLKIIESYEVSLSSDGKNYEIHKIKKAGDEVLEVEELAYNNEDMKFLPQEIKLKILFLNKKRGKVDVDLLKYFEDLKFSLQNGDNFFEAIDEIEKENPEVHIEYKIDVEKPYVIINKNGYKKKFEFIWDKMFQCQILAEADMVIPFEIAERIIREINAGDLLLNEIAISIDGDYVMIKGIKFYFKDKKLKDRLKDLNPDLYKKICMVMAGKTIDEKAKKSIKENYEKLKLIKEEEDELEMEEISYEEEMDVTKILSFQRYLDSVLSKNIEGPLYKVTVSNEEMMFYLGNRMDVSLFEFKQLAEEILKEKIGNVEEVKGWAGATEIYIKNVMEKEKYKEKYKENEYDINREK